MLRCIVFIVFYLSCA